MSSEAKLYVQAYANSSTVSLIITPGFLRRNTRCKSISQACFESVDKLRMNINGLLRIECLTSLTIIIARTC
jgi:hypothetical protein